MIKPSNTESASPPQPPRDDVYIVVPAYNEAQALLPVLQELRAHYPNVVVVDDGSSDATFEIARAGGAYALRHIINRGQGAALQTGIEFSLARHAKYIVTFDADAQHRVEDISTLLEPILENRCDIVLGSRFLRGTSTIPFGRKVTLRLAVLFSRLMTRIRVTDTHNGLRAFSRRAALTINLKLDRMAHASELLDQIRQSGLAFEEAPVEIRYTAYSLRKGQSARGAVRILFHYLLGRVLP